MPEGVNCACAFVGFSVVVLASKAVTDRPNDPVAELSGAPAVANSSPDRILGAPSKDGIDGTAAHRDVAAFVAARAAARAPTRADVGAPAIADDLAASGRDGPPPTSPPPPDPAPHLEPVVLDVPPRPDARPRIVEDPAILGLSRVSRSRLGSRLFTLFFVFVYALILVQLIVSLLQT